MICGQSTGDCWASSVVSGKIEGEEVLDERAGRVAEEEAKSKLLLNSFYQRPKPKQNRPNHPPKHLAVDSTTQNPGAVPNIIPIRSDEPNSGSFLNTSSGTATRTSGASIGPAASSSICVTNQKNPNQKNHMVTNSRQNQSVIAHANRMRQKRQSTGGTLPKAPAHHHHFQGLGTSSNPTMVTTPPNNKKRMSGSNTASPRASNGYPRHAHLGHHLRPDSPEGRDEPEMDKRQADRGQTQAQHHHHHQQQHHRLNHHPTVQDTPSTNIPLDSTTSSTIAILVPPSQDENDQDENDEEDALFLQSELTCDYDRSPTVLYELLEASSWEEAKDRTKSNHEEARTWIVRKDKNQRVRWKLMPLHASIIFQAPTSVIVLLLETYPAAAKRRDDQGMLPLHLAFRHKQDDEGLLEALLKHYPKAVFLKDKRDRIPLEHGRDLKFSSKMMRTYAEAHVNAVSTAKPGSIPRHPSPPRGAHKSHAPLASRDTGQGEEQYHAQQQQLREELARTKQKHNEEIKRLQRDYEAKLAVMRERIDQEALHAKRLAAEERQTLVKCHTDEVAELRNLLNTQTGRENTLMSDLQAQIDDLQTALENANTQNDQMSEKFKTMENHSAELRLQLHRIVQDQLFIRDLAARQSSELEASRRSRAQIIQSLVEQEETDQHNDHIRGMKLLEVTDNVRDRIQILMRSGLLADVGDVVPQPLMSALHVATQQQPAAHQNQRGASRMDIERNQHGTVKISPPGEAEIVVTEEDEVRVVDDAVEIQALRIQDDYVDITNLTSISMGDDISAITEHSP